MDLPADAIDSSTATGHDPALLPFLRAADGADAERLLADLLGLRLAHTIRDVVGRVLHVRATGGRAWRGEDLDDVTSEAVTRVLRTLRDVKADETRGPIHNVEAYAATIATHTCYEHLRKRHPERVRLRNQIWYVLSRDPGLTLDRQANGAWMCGLAPGRRRDAPPIDAPDHASLPHLVRTSLALHTGPLELNELVDLVARATGVHDVWRDTTLSDVEPLPDQRARLPTAALESAQYLRQLWSEVIRLPLRQRIALLLNLRDASGNDALDLFPMTGTASLREIARTLDLDAEELARLWAHLPLDDRRIAERLGVSRQQVINLRKAARARLGRRMAAPAHGRSW